jgi:hypothetical protein
MIQRIQTIFLLLAAGFFGGTALLPLMRSSEPIPTSRYFSDGIFQAGDHPLLFAITALGAVLALAAVFLYRKRPLQMQLALFSALAVFLAAVVMAVFFFQDQKNSAEWRPLQHSIGAYLAIPGIVSALLARYFIRKDEKLVRSMDRLR